MAEDEQAPAAPKRPRRPRATEESREAPSSAPARPDVAPSPSSRRTAREAAKPQETTPQPAPTARKVRDARLSNLVSPATTRTRQGRTAASERSAPEVGEAAGPTHRPGDIPPSLTRRYFSETLRGGATIAFYEGPGAKKAAFHDHGSHLATDQTAPALIRDMAAIAAHRRWATIEVKGADEFRRELWLEARALGLEVKGYKPRERDQQELDRRLVAQAKSRSPAPPSDKAAPRTRIVEPETSKGVARARPDFDTGVAGTLIATGEAPYRRRAGEPTTPFIRIDRGEGRALDIWGAGLPDALKRSGAGIGDAVQVRRDGVDVLQRTIEVRDPRTGLSTPQARQVNRNRWIIEAERFRRSTSSEAARDEQLKGAQSHLSVLNTVIDGAIKDPERRERLRAEAREIVADELAQGRRFTPARIREVEPMLARDLGPAQAREIAAERVHRR